MRDSGSLNLCLDCNTSRDSCRWPLFCPRNAWRRPVQYGAERARTRPQVPFRMPSWDPGYVCPRSRNMFPSARDRGAFGKARLLDRFNNEVAPRPSKLTQRKTRPSPGRLIRGDGVAPSWTAHGGRIRALHLTVVARHLEAWSDCSLWSNRTPASPSSADIRDDNHVNEALSFWNSVPGADGSLFPIASVPVGWRLG